MMLASTWAVAESSPCRFNSSVIGSILLFVAPQLTAALDIAGPLRLAPHLARCLGHEFQLRDLVADRHGVTADA